MILSAAYTLSKRASILTSYMAYYAGASTQASGFARKLFRTC
jgi:hypothetical protein